MRYLNSIAVAAFAVLLPAGGAAAADAIAIPLSTEEAMPTHEQGGFDWGGFYAGIYGALDVGPTDLERGIGVQAGVNAQIDFYLVGAEVAVTGMAGSVGDSSYGQILGRAGLVATDNALVYAAGGYGIDLGTPSEQDILLGGGVEFAVTDSVSLRAQYLHGFPLDGADSGDQITFGANFHF